MTFVTFHVDLSMVVCDLTSFVLLRSISLILPCCTELLSLSSLNMHTVHEFRNWSRVQNKRVGVNVKSHTEIIVNELCI